MSHGTVQRSTPVGASARRLRARAALVLIFLSGIALGWSVALAVPDPDALSPGRKLSRLGAQDSVGVDPEERRRTGAALAEARRLADEKQFGEAARLLRYSLTEDPKNLPLRSLLARVLAWDRKYGESIEEYERILAAYPDDAYDRAGYARVLAWSGRRDASLREFRKAVAADSTDLEARIGYARALSWAGDLAGADREYRRILRADSTRGDAWLGAATVARWRGAATASDRLLSRAQAHRADREGIAEERGAVRRALAPAAGGGWMSARERQYVPGDDFTIKSEGPFAYARATAGRAVDLTLRLSRLEQQERNSGTAPGDTALNYDVSASAVRLEAAYLREYPFQASAALERRSLDPGVARVLYPLANEDGFTGWSGRLWRHAGRFTPRLAARRDYLPIKSTSGPRRILPGAHTAVEAGLDWHWSGRGAARAALEHGSYTDDNERVTARAGGAYTLRTGPPRVAVDYDGSYTDFDAVSRSYFTPRSSWRHAAAVALSGYSERAALDYGARYQVTSITSSNFEHILTNTWSAYLNVGSIDDLPLGLEGSYSRDNNAYETWFVGLSGAVRW